MTCVSPDGTERPEHTPMTKDGVTWCRKCGCDLP